MGMVEALVQPPLEHMRGGQVDMWRRIGNNTLLVPSSHIADWVRARRSKRLEGSYCSSQSVSLRPASSLDNVLSPSITP